MVVPELLKQIDLTIYSSTVPKKQYNEITRDFIIKNIQDTFSENNRVIMIQGDNSSGKSTLLAQFVKKYKDRSISFFIGEDYWTSNVNFFLTELCNQMALLCSQGIKNQLSKIVIDDLDEFKIKQLFNKMYSDICKQARQKQGPFYFVIDGLEKIDNQSGEENILKYIPRGNQEGVYILLSSLKTIEYNFSYFPMQIPFFSFPETEQLLKGLLEYEEIEKIYDVCSGMPGYICEILRQLNNGIPKQDVIENLPSSFNKLLENIWMQYDNGDPFLYEILSLIVYSPEKLNIETLTKIMRISKSTIEDLVNEVGFLVVQGNDNLDILAPYKAFLKDKLVENKAKSLQSLIEYYESNPYVNGAVIFLPELYMEHNQYQSLVNLVKIENIYEIISNTKQISIARKHLRTLSAMAYQKKDWINLSWATLTEAVFTKLVTTAPAIESQVKALLSLGHHEDALSLAFKCSLPEDRLILLSHIAKYMKQKKLNISQDIMNSIEESIALIDKTVELSEELIDKLSDISSNLFTINPTLALQLIQKIADETGQNIEKHKLIDYLLFNLLIKVDKEDENLEQIKNHIQNDALNDYMKVTSEEISEDHIDKVFEQIEGINETSAKIFYMQEWCYINKERQDSYKVVERALDLMIESDNFTPSLRQLRTFAESLLYCGNLNETKQLVSIIENLEASLIKNPIQEYTLLELTISKIENKWSEDAAIERYYRTYVFMDEIKDLDSKCLVICQLWEASDTLFQNDKKITKELRDLLIADYNRLLQSSADHFKISKTIIQMVTKLDKNLSYIFASKLNTKTRRFKAFAEILIAHINSENVDFDFIDLILDQIKEKFYKDWIFVQVLNKVSELNEEVSEEIKLKFFGKIKSIESVIGKSFGFSFYINWLKDNEDKVKAAFNELKVSLGKIDTISDKVKLGFNIVQILSKTQKELASNLYQTIVFDYLKNNGCFDERLNHLFIELSELLIRMVPDIIKDQENKGKLRHIKSIIISIPDSFQQCRLLTSLAIRCLNNGHKEFFYECVESCLEILDRCSEDTDTKNQILVSISPILYVYQSGLFFEKLEEINSIEIKDTALQNVIRFIISKRPSEDPLDIKNIQQKLDYPEASAVCDIIQNLDDDSSIYSMIHCLVEGVLEPTANNKYKSKLKEKQLLNIVQRLVDIINKKLPNEQNIKHDGYKLACLGLLAKLRDTSTSRANSRWDSLFLSRQEIRREAMKISNVADKIFVLASLGEASYNFDPVIGTEILQDSEENLRFITNVFDRIDRYEKVAEAYHKISNHRAAKFLIEEALSCAKACTSEQGRDQLLGGLIEFTHTIDPALAQSFASSIDSKEALLNLNDKLLMLNLHSDPQKIEYYRKEQTKRILNDFFEKVLRSLCSGRGTVQHDEVVGRWISYSIGHDFETIVLAVSWYVENLIAGNKKKISKSELTELLYGLTQLLEFIRKVEHTIYQQSTAIDNDSFYKVITQSNLQTFGLDEQEEAFSTIRNWISDNSSEYLYIYDPFFNEEMLELLKNTFINTRVTIITSARKGEVNDLKNRYINFWLKICDQAPPETHFYVLSTNSGNTPLHDRYVTTRSVGLSLGTSLNGFGNKISSIQYLDNLEKEKIENDNIFPMLFRTPQFYHDERLFLDTFTLIG